MSDFDTEAFALRLPGAPLLIPPTPASSVIDLVVLVDGSGSMSTHAATLRGVIDEGIEQASKQCGNSPKRVEFLTVDFDGLHDGIQGNFASSGYVSHQSYLMGTGNPGPFAEDAGGAKLGAVAEEGADAIADLASMFDWTEGSCRSILYVSDTLLDGNTPSAGAIARAEAAIDNAITVCNQNDVTVFAHYLKNQSEGGFDTAVAANQYDRLCDGTGGRAETNADPGSVTYTELLAEAICGACNAKEQKPAFSACCPPWNNTLFDDLFWHPPSAFGGDYKLSFAPEKNKRFGKPFSLEWLYSPWMQNPIFKQLQAYVEYVNAVTGLSKLTIHFAVFDMGAFTYDQNGHIIKPDIATNGLKKFSKDYWVSWVAGHKWAPLPINLLSALKMFEKLSFKTNHWYKLHSGIYMPGGTFFELEECNQDGAKLFERSVHERRGSTPFQIDYARERVFTAEDAELFQATRMRILGEAEPDEETEPLDRSRR